MILFIDFCAMPWLAWLLPFILGTLLGYSLWGKWKREADLYHNKLKAAERDNLDLQNKLAAANKKSDLLESDIAKMKGAIRDAQRDLTSCQDKLRASETTVARIESEKDDALVKLSERTEESSHHGLSDMIPSDAEEEADLPEEEEMTIAMPLQQVEEVIDEEVTAGEEDASLDNLILGTGHGAQPLSNLNADASKLKDVEIEEVQQVEELNAEDDALVVTEETDEAFVTVDEGDSAHTMHLVRDLEEDKKKQKKSKKKKDKDKSEKKKSKKKKKKKKEKQEEQDEISDEIEDSLEAFVGDRKPNKKKKKNKDKKKDKDKSEKKKSKKKKKNKKKKKEEETRLPIWPDTPAEQEEPKATESRVDLKDMASGLVAGKGLHISSDSNEKKSTASSGSKSSSVYDRIEDTNLQIVEGVGPRMEAVLKENGISDWSMLASKTPDDLRALLGQYGDKYRIIDPSSWSTQAAKADRREWDELIQYQLGLNANSGAKVNRSEAKIQKLVVKLGLVKRYTENDLKAIEGIGPKIAHLLQNKGINTWQELADKSVEELNAILEEAGPRYQLADPTTWPQQATYAANGQFEDLLVYQEFLKGGR